MLGEAKVPIIDIDLTMPVDEWRILQPEFKMETKGVCLVSVCVPPTFTIGDKFFPMVVVGNPFQ